MPLSTPATVSATVFGHRAFALFWIGRIVSILSFQMLMVAIGWQLYALTGSALDLGLIGLAQFVPMIVLTLLVGHVADRYDHRLILLACQFVEAGAAAGLALGTVMGWLDPLAIYALTALVGAARAFDEQIGIFNEDLTFDPRAVTVLKQSFLEMGLLKEIPDDKAMFTTQFLPVKAGK